MSTFNFLVGTFNTPSLYTLSFCPSPSPPSSSSKVSLKILKKHNAVGSHSWLALSNDRKHLYATAWLEPPSVAAYVINSPTDIRLLNTAPTQSRSGYVCCSESHVYSAGGATGEVFAIDRTTGALQSPQRTSITNGITTTANGVKQSPISPVQLLDFVSDKPQKDDGSTMDFGGLRHGAHSADLSPDGKYLYIADIGRNCIWTFSTTSTTMPDTHLELVEKHISPRGHDGPRHVWPHPNGKVVYVLQEHSSMVDVFSVDPSTGLLRHVQGVRIIPHGLPVNEFWADEVRTSFSNGNSPKFLYASTRGLKEGRKGFVAVYQLDGEGLIEGAKTVESTVEQNGEEPDDQDQGGLLCMYETATSGGWANAIQPGPTFDGMEYLALTDSEVGNVFVLSWDGQSVQEVARVNLNDETNRLSNGDSESAIIGAATAVWL